MISLNVFAKLPFMKLLLQIKLRSNRTADIALTPDLATDWFCKVGVAAVTSLINPVANKQSHKNTKRRLWE